MRERADARPPFGEPEVGIGLEPQAMQRQTLAPIRSPISPMPSTGIRTSRDFIGCAPFFPTFAPRPDVAHGPPMTSLERRRIKREGALACGASCSEIFALTLRSIWRSAGRLVVLCGENGAGKTNLLEALSLFSPGRGLRRAELQECARVGGAGGFALSIEIEEDGETHQLGSALEARAPTATKRSGCNRIDRAAVASSRAFCDHVRIVWLTPAMDSLFAGPASERRRFLDRFVLAIDPNHGARVGQFERALRGRNRLLEEGGRNASWLDAIEREAAELGVAVAAARLECVRRLEALIAADRDDSSPFPWAKLALEGEVEAMTASGPALAAEDRYRAILRDNRSRDAAAGRTLIGPHLSDLHGLARAEAGAGGRVLDRRAEGAHRRARARPRAPGRRDVGHRAARAPRRNRGAFRSAPPRRAVRRARAPRRPGVPHRRRPGGVRRA